ncbi:caspase-9 isoform X2 [Brachyhypopomus gauderio]
MDARHKNILQLNRTSIVRDLDPSKVYDGLLSRGIFTEDMVEEIKCAGTRRDQARKLVKDLQMRGRAAFPAFVECLRESGHQTLADLLESRGPITVPTSLPVLPSTVPFPRPHPVHRENPDRGDGSQKLVPLKPALPVLSPADEGITPRPSRQRRESIQCYKMEANPCGMCLIINNVDFHPASDLKNRTGSDIDCDKLRKRFESFNFCVTVKRNLRCKEIKHQLSVLSSTDHSGYDCCVVVILSHGTESNNNRFPGAVHGVDGLPVSVQIMTDYLNGKRCPSLQGKPKLFFIQACGGDQKDTGFEVSPDEVQPVGGRMDEQTDAIPSSSSSDSLSLTDEPDARATLPTPSDILVSYSTFPGYVSWRDCNTGSWYVETLDCILEMNAVTDDLVTMLMMVNDEVSQISAKGMYKQMPGSFNFLRKLFYFQTSKA